MARWKFADLPFTLHGCNSSKYMTMSKGCQKFLPLYFIKGGSAPSKFINGAKWLPDSFLFCIEVLERKIIYQNAWWGRKANHFGSYTYGTSVFALHWGNVVASLMIHSGGDSHLSYCALESSMFFLLTWCFTLLSSHLHPFKFESKRDQWGKSLFLWYLTELESNNTSCCGSQGIPKLPISLSVEKPKITTILSSSNFQIQTAVRCQTRAGPIDRSSR